MRYRLFVRDPEGKPLTVSGFKQVRDDPEHDVWDDTSTLFTSVYEGHLTAHEEAGATPIGAGVIRVHLMDFLHQLTTFEVEGASAVERAEMLSRFGSFFMGRLWDVYGRRVLTYAPM